MVIRTMRDVEEGIRALSAIEPRFAECVAVTGLPPLRRAEGGFTGLLRIMVEQQLSTASAAAIWRRMQESLAPLTPESLGRRGDEALRAAGLSRPKIATLRALCAAAADGTLDFDLLDRAGDEEVMERLTTIRGIGPWTAEIYMLSCLGRRDVWPAGDLALQVAVERTFELEARPDAKRMREIGEPWRPWRAVAARVLWSYYRALRTNPR